MWLFQVYEYRKFLRDWNKKDLSKFYFQDWRNVESKIVMMQGRYKGLEWRKKNIFCKKYIEYFERMLKSKEFQNYKKENYYESLEDAIRKQKK